MAKPKEKNQNVSGKKVQGDISLANSQNGHQDSANSAEKVKEQIKNRFWRAVNYMSISLFYLFVYGFGVICEYVLYSLIWYLLGEEIRNYPVIKSAVSYSQIGLALMTITGAIVHGMFSILGQLQMERHLAQES